MTRDFLLQMYSCVLCTPAIGIIRGPDFKNCDISKVRKPLWRKLRERKKLYENVNENWWCLGGHISTARDELQIN